MISRGKNARTSRGRSERNLLIVTGILALLAITLSFAAHWLSPFPGDLKVTLWFQSLHSNALFSIMQWVSYIAQGWQSALLVIVSAVIVWWRIGKLEAALTLAAGLSTLLDSALKLIVGRPRPPSVLVKVWVVVHNNGFPSGHAFYSMVFLGLMAYFAFTYMRKSGLRMLIFVSLIVLVILIGASRVYLGAHWPSDVLGGYLWGATFLGIFIWLYRRLGRGG